MGSINNSYYRGNIINVNANSPQHNSSVIFLQGNNGGAINCFSSTKISPKSGGYGKCYDDKQHIFDIIISSTRYKAISNDFFD